MTEVLQFVAGMNVRPGREVALGNQFRGTSKAGDRLRQPAGKEERDKNADREAEESQQRCSDRKSVV